MASFFKTSLPAAWKALASGAMLLPLIVLAGATAIQAETAATVEVAATAEDDVDHVMDRQLVMQQLDRNSKGLGNVLAGLEPASKLAFYAKAVAADAKEARASFLVKEPGGSANPEVWSNWEDFSRRMDQFVVKSEEMAKVSETGNVVTVTELVIDAMPCRSCHLVYRAQKK